MEISRAIVKVLYEKRDDQLSCEKCKIAREPRACSVRGAYVRPDLSSHHGADMHSRTIVALLAFLPALASAQRFTRAEKIGKLSAPVLMDTTGMFQELARRQMIDSEA